MKNKFQLLFIPLTIVIVSFPSICFSEMKTVTGEFCGDNKTITDKTVKQAMDQLLTDICIENGLHKVIDDVGYFRHDFIHTLELYNFKVISHTETNKKICKKVQFTVDTELLKKKINSYEESNHKSIDLQEGEVKRKSICWRNGYGKNGYNDLEIFLKKYTQKKEKPISMGVIIDNRTTNLKEVEFEKNSDEIEKILVGCLVEELGKKVKIIERRNLNKILEEHKLSISGITGGSLKLGKIEDLDIIFHRTIYDDRFTTKLLNVETGEVLYVSTNNIIKEKLNDSSDIVDNENNKSQKIMRKIDRKEWMPFSRNDEDVGYYNKTNITKSSNNLLVWTKRFITDEVRKYSTDYWEKQGELELSKKYQNYDYSLVLIEIDCRNRLFRPKETVDYDDKGSVIKSHKHTGDFQNFIPDTMGYYLYKNICVTPKNPSMKK